MFTHLESFNIEQRWLKIHCSSDVHSFVIPLSWNNHHIVSPFSRILSLLAACICLKPWFIYYRYRFWNVFQWLLWLLSLKDVDKSLIFNQIHQEKAEKKLVHIASQRHFCMQFSASVVGRLIRFWLDFESKLTKTSISTVFPQRRLQAKLFCCLAQIFLMFRFFFSFDFDWFFQFAIYFTCYNSVFNGINCNLDIYVYMASTDFNLGKKKVIRHTSYGKQHSRNSRNAESRYLIFFWYTLTQLWRITIGQGPQFATP